LPGCVAGLLSVRRTTGTTRTTRATIGTRTTRTAIATWSARTTGTHLVAWTTRTTATRTAAATRTTRTTGTTGTTTATIAIATSAARTTTTRTTLVTRRGRELPTDARARHLAATRTIVFLLLFFRARRLHEAAEATRLVAITAPAAGTTGTAGTAATTTAITAAATSAITTAATAIVVACTAAITTRWRSDAIDHVVELAARDGTVRTGFALEHAHETNLIDAITDDVERLEQTRRAIGLHTERARDRVDRRIRCCRRRGCCFGARLTAFTAGFSRRCFRSRRFGWSFAAFRGLTRRRSLLRGRRGLSRCSSCGRVLARGGRITEEER
jgi:hypothetical protein